MLVTLIGSSPGESIIIEFSDGQFATIDSAANRKENYTLSYLRNNKISGKHVKHCIFTHFDSDHIKGATDLLEYCSEAEIIIPNCWKSEEFKHFVAAASDESLAGGANSLAREIRKLFDYISDNKRIVLLATERKCIYPKAGIRSENSERLTILSPSSEKENNFILALGRAIKENSYTKELEVGTRNRNETSICCLLEDDDEIVLLAGDLENRPGDAEIDRICDTYLENCKYVGFLKMPHHGSATSFSEKIRCKIAPLKTVVGITPYPNAVRPLPNGDAQLFLSGQDRVYVTKGKNIAKSRDTRKLGRDFASIIPISEKSAGILCYYKGEIDHQDCCLLDEFLS